VSDRPDPAQPDLVPFEDDRIRFAYPAVHQLKTASEHGQFYYSFHLRGRRTPAAVFQLLTREEQADPYRKMYPTYQPLDHPHVRQIVHRHGPITGARFTGLQLRTTEVRPSDGTTLADSWDVFLDFGGVWGYFSTFGTKRKPLNEAAWARVLESIEVR
jgi:hypothetical protein